DLTPIGVNLGRKVQGYRAYSAPDAGAYPAAPDAPNGVGAQLLGSVDFATASGDKSVDRISFSMSIPAPIAPEVLWVRPYDGALDGTPSNMLSDQPQVNTPPLA